MRKIKVNPKKITDELKQITSFLDENFFIAGGAIRCLLDKTKVDDYDIFSTGMGFDLKKWYELEDKLIKDGFKVTFRCPLGYLVSLKKDTVKVQLIKQYHYQHFNQIRKEFDFSATMMAMYQNEVYAELEDMKDIAIKKLRIINLKAPVATFNRINKYKDKGYKIKDAVAEYVNMLRQKDESEQLNMAWYVD